MSIKKKIGTAMLSLALCISGTQLPTIVKSTTSTAVITANAADLTINNIPSEYQYAADWIWQNRIQGEKSVEAWDTIYDKIVAGNGTLNYVVRWQSYSSITLEQRRNLQQVLESAVNDWTNWLVGYENWPYSHVNVKIVGWAVIDENCLLDRQPDEVVYTDTVPYDPSYDIQNGMGDSRIPTVMPIAPEELFRYEHWRDPNWSYNGSYENRYDMHLTATLGMINMGGYGYYWGQQLSDEAVLGLANGTTSVHILEHEVGHGFGFTDFYGGEGESDGFPPGGFPDGGGSLMMAGSSSVITDFDGWFARYVWTKISSENGRFDLTQNPPQQPEKTSSASLTDTITGIGEGYLTFEQNGTYYYSGDFYGGDEEKNLAHYEIGDKIAVSFTYYDDSRLITNIDSLTLIQNSRPEKVKGDVNADGQFNVSDVVLLQKWLLAVPNTYLADWKAADLCEDDRLDVFDLCLMKRLLISGSNVPDPPTEEGQLLAATVNKFGKSTPSIGNAKMLMVYVDFADKKYGNNAYSNAQMENELFGEGTGSYPYESVATWFERSSYGNLHIDGDVYSYTCSGNMSEYSSGGYEKMAMEVLRGLDGQIDYSQYDENNDGVIDCLSFTVPLDDVDDSMKEYWYGCTATWYDNPSFSIDNMRVNNFIIMDVMPYASNMQYLKQTLIHEMGHSIGLPDYYLYNAGDDWDGLNGDAGYERMDDSIADFSSFSKLMFGWLKDTEVQSYSGNGKQNFTLDDASSKGSCLILPISSQADDYTSEYFLVEYITKSGNNSDMYTNDSGIRIFHIQSELYTTAWGDTNFMYEGFSEKYMGNDKVRVVRLVNDNGGFYHTGDTVSYGVSNFAGYDSNGDQTINTGYTITIGANVNGQYELTVSK